MQTDIIENKVVESVDTEHREMECPHCEERIGWRYVSTWYTSQIGKTNPGRKISKEEAVRMARARWDKVKPVEAPAVVEPAVEPAVAVVEPVVVVDESPFTPDVMARLAGGGK